MPTISNLIRDAEKIDLSGSDIETITQGAAHIMSYEQLHKYTTIDQVFGTKEAIILLYQTRQNFGHWTCLIKQSDSVLSFFDSYGFKIDSELKYADYNLRIHQGKVVPHLSHLILQSDYKVMSNTRRLQKFAKDINTCGRYTAMRVRLRHLNNDQFDRLFLNQRDSPDYLVSSLTIVYSL